MRKVIALLFGALIASMLPAVSQATMTTLSFHHIQTDNLINATIGEAQLRVDVVEVGGSVVDFVFKNIGPAAGSISEIYFDDGSILALAQIFDNPPTVDFIVGATPSNLPSGENAGPELVATAAFSTQANNPESKKGINPNEQLTLRYTLQTGKYYQNVVNDLTTGELRIGVHIKSFEQGSSQSFVNNLISNPVPEPATMVLLGLGGLLLRRRK